VQDRKIKFRLDGYFVSITNSETAGVKPNQLFLNMLYEWLMQQRTGIMIGDSLDTDVEH
jgi:ribonucleotide monophosphatase NagD (HAD superfamily)